jgi:hypothetical protein
MGDTMPDSLWIYITGAGATEKPILVEITGSVMRDVENGQISGVSYAYAGSFPPDMPLHDFHGEVSVVKYTPQGCTWDDANRRIADILRRFQQGPWNGEPKTLQELGGLANSVRIRAEYCAGLLD